MKKDIIVVTGFGPFGEHKINASWEAVKILPSLVPDDLEIINIEVPVTYKDVDKYVADIWKTYEPKLVVHVGVSSYANKVTIEKLANRTGYNKLDCKNNYHSTKEVCTSNEGCDTIFCDIDVSKISKEINSVYKNEVTCVSDNAGRYLCEYIFYKSLNINKKRTMFIHVPPLENPFTAQELAEYILEIIKTSLKQMNCSCSSVNI